MQPRRDRKQGIRQGWNIGLHQLQAGATIKETMRRLGQSTVQAALIYQHASDDRDSDIAEALGKRIVDDLRKAKDAKDGGQEAGAAG